MGVREEKFGTANPRRRLALPQFAFLLSHCHWQSAFPLFVGCLRQETDPAGCIHERWLRTVRTGQCASQTTW